MCGDRYAPATGADIVAATHLGCLIQLRSGLAERGGDTRIKHIVELLDAATAPSSRINYDAL